MKTLTDIQSQVRVYASDSTLVLTDNTDTKVQGLNISNRIYRKLCNLNHWPEIMVINEDLSTVPGQQGYDFGVKYGTFKYGQAKYGSIEKFINVTSIEIKNEFGVYEVIPAVKSELDWSHFSSMDNSFPSVYQIRSVNGNYTVLLAPIPQYATTLKIKGIIEPTFFTSGSSTTVFFSSLLDDALEYLIASEILFTDGDERGATVLIQKASSLISKYAGREITAKEIDPRAEAPINA